MARSRTTKTLAKRIELDYFHKPHALRTWRGRLSLTAVALSAAYLIWVFLPGNRLAWSAGGLTTAHATLGADCASCHKGTSVEDTACVACHAGPTHSTRQIAAPACASCHAEHRGTSLVAVNDTHCGSCHASLTTTTGAPVETAASITSFPAGHPEFDAVARGSDPGHLRLNHRLHLKPGLRGADGSVTLACGSCHHLEGSGGRMLPVTYERDCRGCHPLVFDTEGRFPEGTVVPHGDIAAARSFLLDRYAGAAVANAAAAGETDPVARALARHRARAARGEPPARVPLSAPAGSERGFVVERVDLTLRVLQRQTCAFCHGVAYEEAAAQDSLPAAPSIPKPAVPAVWMPAAEYSHRAHRTLACLACHVKAGESEKTSDFLIPGAGTCGTCHHGAQSAPSTCITCHRYHPAEDDPLYPSRLGLP